MKPIYNFILAILTTAMLVLLTFNAINNSTHWVDLSKYQEIIGYISAYGPMVLLCLFAFGTLVGKVASKILGICIFLLLVIFTIAMFAPNVITSIFGSNAPKAIFYLLK